MMIFTQATIGRLQFESVVKKPDKLGAAQIDDEFHVPSPGGEVSVGKAGDYLVCDAEDNLSVVTREDMTTKYRPFNTEFDR